MRIGSYYLAGSLVLMGLGWMLRPWGFLAFWPAVSLAAVAGAYFGWGPGVYGKHGGRLPAWRRMVLGPVLAGQWLSWRHYSKRSRAWDVIAEGVWLGRVLTEHEARRAIEDGVTAVLDVTGEFRAPRAFRDLGSNLSLVKLTRHAHFSEARADGGNDSIALEGPANAYLNIPILDLTAPSDDQLSEAIAFIRAHVAHGGVVYVHCKAGYSRSAAVVGAWLISSGRVGSAAEAVALLKEKRPGIMLRPEAVAAMEHWEHRADRAIRGSSKARTEPAR